MVVILAFLQGVETSREIFYYFDLWPVNPCLGPGFSVDIVSHSATALVLVAGHTHHLWKCFPRSEALRKGGEAWKGFTEVRFLASHRSTSAEARVQFPEMMWLLQQQDQPFMQYYCSLSTAHLANSVTNWDRFIKLPHSNGSPAWWILPASCRHRDHSQIWSRFLQGPPARNGKCWHHWLPLLELQE